MNTIRKIVGFFMAVMLTAFALPAVADSGDQYHLVMPASISDGVEFSVTITNRARWDFLKSFTITAPAVPPGVSITSVLSGSSSIPQTKISWSAGSISVSNIAIAYNQTGTLKIKATIPHSCDPQTLTWPSTAKGGLLVNNEVFNPDFPNPVPTNVSADNCVMSVTWPAIVAVSANPALAGDPFTVTAQLTGGMPGGKSVTISTATGCPTLGGTTSATTDSSGNAVIQPTLKGLPGPCTLTATPSDSHYKPQPQSKSFDVYATVGCDDPSTNFATNVPASNLDPNAKDAYLGDTGWGLRRGPNPTGQSCAPVSLTCKVGAHTADCVFDDSSGQNPALKYVILWNAVDVDSIGDTTGWSQFRPYVSWIHNPTPYPSADWVPALACAEDIEITNTTPRADVEKVMPIIPSVFPFTNYTDPSSPYFPGKTALMCIAQQGMTSVGVGVVSGKFQVQYWDKVIDISDGHVFGP